MEAAKPITTRVTSAATPTAGDITLQLAIVALTVATAAIHVSLGGLLFLANAAGYTALALALIAPFGLAREYRWLVRLALLGFTLATIAGWVVFGARIPVAYLDKGIEALLVACVVATLYRLDGSPLEVLGRVVGLARAVTGRPAGRGR